MSSHFHFFIVFYLLVLKYLNTRISFASFYLNQGTCLGKAFLCIICLKFVWTYIPMPKTWRFVTFVNSCPTPPPTQICSKSELIISCLSGYGLLLKTNLKFHQHVIPTLKTLHWSDWRNGFSHQIQVSNIFKIGWAPISIHLVHLFISKYLIVIATDYLPPKKLWLKLNSRFLYNI